MSSARHRVLMAGAGGPRLIVHCCSPSGCARAHEVGSQQWAISWGILIMFYISCGSSFLAGNVARLVSPRWGTRMIFLFGMALVFCMFRLNRSLNALSIYCALFRTARGVSLQFQTDGGNPSSSPFGPVYWVVSSADDSCFGTCQLP